MSVCVVHRDGWAVCDSRINNGSTGVLPGKCDKAFTSSGTLITCVGDGIVEQMVRMIADQHPEAELIDAIMAYAMEEEPDGCILLTNRARELLIIGSDGCRIDLEDDQMYWAIGCADNLVNGYIKGVSKGREATPEDAVEAVVWASRYDSGIDSRAKIYRL